MTQRTAASLLAAVLAAFVLGGAPAYAKAPKPAEMPTVEEIYQQAMTAIAEKAKVEAEKARDPDKEAIDAYRDRKTALTDYARLVDILNNAKDDKIQSYRMDAANALVARFQREEENDPGVRAVRRDIALKILGLMKAPKADSVGLSAIETILFNWWRAQMQIEIKFKATDKPDDRKRAYDKLKKFLSKAEN